MACGFEPILTPEFLMYSSHCNILVGCELEVCACVDWHLQIDVAIESMQREHIQGLISPPSASAWYQWRKNVFFLALRNICWCQIRTTNICRRTFHEKWWHDVHYHRVERRSCECCEYDKQYPRHSWHDLLDQPPLPYAVYVGWEVIQCARAASCGIKSTAWFRPTTFRTKGAEWKTKQKSWGTWRKTEGVQSTTGIQWKAYPLATLPGKIM